MVGGVVYAKQSGLASGLAPDIVCLFAAEESGGVRGGQVHSYAIRGQAGGGCGCGGGERRGRCLLGAKSHRAAGAKPRLPFRVDRMRRLSMFA